MPHHPLSTAIRWFVALSSRVHLISTCQVVADSFRGIVLRLFGKRIPLRIVENAIELENFAPDMESRQKIREELHLSENEFVIGIVGLITPRKGQLGLINFFYESTKRNSSINIVDCRSSNVQ
jgi:glycosyltransferase involved in cell wall biosynthesis